MTTGSETTPPAPEPDRWLESVFVPNRDFKLNALLPLTPDAIHTSLRRGASIKTPALRPAAVAFHVNIVRTDGLAEMLPTVFLAGEKYGLSGKKMLAMPFPELNFTFPEKYHSTLKEKMSWLRMVSQQNQSGFDAWLSAIVLGAWTAFEILAGDLWEATINCHPAGLALLRGEERRIGARAGNSRGAGPVDNANRGDSEKVISLQRLHDATRGTYDVAGRMGTLLRSRYVFTALPDIRRAYSLAFSDKIDKDVVDAVDAALADNALDALSIVRNVLVHKGGVADEEYMRDSRRVTAVPKLEAGKRVLLDGELVRLLVDPVISRCVELIAVIDGWLSAEVSRAQAVTDPPSPRASGGDDGA